MQTLRQQMDTGTMSRYQWGTVALCVLMQIVDGFDILIVAYTATSLTNEWNLSGGELGLLLSAGLFGMAAGTLFISPYADKFGRRPLVLACLVISSLGMVFSAMADGPLMLGILRVITGLGMGGVIVSGNVIASEFASARWRGLAVSLNTTGYALGAVVGGIVAIWLQAQFSWRGVFLFGAGITVVAFFVLLVRMPESVDFLYLSKSPRALERVNALAGKMGKAEVTELTSPAAAPAPAKTESSIVRLFARNHRRSTIIVCCGFFLNMFGYYFVQSWTPRLLVSAGLTESQGNIGGTLLNLGGMAGSVFIGLLVARLPLKVVLTSFLTISGALLCVYASAPSSLLVAFIVAVLIGLFVNGCMAGLFTLVTGVYEPGVRATAVGLGITVGRIGAIVAPIVVGTLVDLNWTTSALYLLMSVAFFAAAVAVSRIKRKTAPTTDPVQDLVRN